MTGKTPVKFELPEIVENKDGWGPSFIPEKFVDMPYQPFSKTDRIGKVADWTGNTYQDRRTVNKYNSQFGAGSQYAYIHEEDDSSFQLVDTSKTHKPMYQRGRFNRANQRLNQRQRQQKQQQQQLQVLSRAGKGRERERMQQVRKWQKQLRQKYENRPGNQNMVKNREASVTVLPSWKVIEEMDFPRLGKLSLPGIDEPVDVFRCGTMEFLDKTYQNINSKNEKPLQRINRVFQAVPTTDDPIIRELATKKTIDGMVKGIDVSDVKVYAIDTIISTLMCSTRSVNSWDVVVHKINDIIFLDKRNTEFDHISVNETAAEPPHEEGNSINSPRNLALEATYINHNFSQQVLKSDEEKVSFENKNPFCQDNTNTEREHASVGYRYRKFNLGGGIGLIVRCEHDAVMTGSTGEIQYINIKALNEWDPRYSGGIDWRQKLDTQKGAVLANELKNNSCKLAKWTVQSILAGSQQLRFGYVSRVHVKDSSKHSILGTQQFKPKEFADQINLNMDNAWGVLRYIVSTCLQLKDGKYLFLKDPNKPVVRLYDIPDDSFESEEEESSDEDED